MAQTITLKDKTTSEPLYPITLLANVLDANGNSLNNLVTTVTGQVSSEWTTLKSSIEDDWEDIQIDIAAYVGTPVVVQSATSGSFALDPNKVYSFGTMTSLTITLNSPTANVNNEYSFEFDSGSTATTVTLPNTIVWSSSLSVKASKHYEVSIKYDQKNSTYYGLFAEF